MVKSFIPCDADGTAEKIRDLLLKLPDDYTRREVLCRLDICLHCGVDEREPGKAPGDSSSCQCWNDE